MTSDKFLRDYKEYEGLLREQGTDPRQIESRLETTDPVKFSRLRITRQLRNYLSHINDPGFIEPTPKMQRFLESEVLTLKMAGDVCKKHLRTPAAAVCGPSDKCVNVLNKMLAAKATIMVCKSDTTYTLHTIFDIASVVLESKAKRMKDVRAIREKPAFVQPTEFMDRLDPTKVTVCTSDGTPEGKLLGVVKFG